MVRNTMNSLEDQVRRRLQQKLRQVGRLSTGSGLGREIGEEDIALEVLYWLPAEFVDAYRELFMQALHLGNEVQSHSGQGNRGGGVVASATGRKKGGSGGGGSHGSGSGTKRYRTEWIVKDETALEVKNRVDRRLRGIIPGMRNQLKREEPWKNPREESHESRGGIGMLMPLGRNGSKMQCRDCGRIARGDWVRCPYPHA